MEFEISKKLTKINTKSTNFSAAKTPTAPLLNKNHFSYEDFFQNYMINNQPCIIEGIGETWESTKKWVINGAPNVNYLNEKYNQSKVIIYNCSERYFNSQKCSEGILDDYMQLWKNRDNQVYYLKDWHLKLQCCNDDFYEVPLYFSSDWLNEYLIATSDDDYRFVYMGQKGSWTPLHTDVFNSYSWSVNICGKKRWVFFPPEAEHQLKDKFNNLPYDISESNSKLGGLEIIQQAGQAVFVPSGWYHQVWNLEDTISINHNWINGCNIQIVWESLKSNLELTKKEVEDCKDMENFEEHCQIMLNAHFGMNFLTFFEFLIFIAKRRLEMLRGGIRVLFHGNTIGTNHILFDLMQIGCVVEDCLKNSEANYVGGDLLKELAVLVQEIAVIEDV